ncbi:MAG: hypothetical protein HDT16_11955 [Oscillibacter sp.]|nr:hypothetical protein [Oscillibacter sp.]
METYRLKNIAIVILLLLNACLLLTLGYQKLQSMRTESRTAEQLHALYQASQLTLREELELFQQPLGPLTLARKASAEQEIASALLGGDAVSTSQGGGIYSYEAASGTIQFRAGGSFYGVRLDLPVADIRAFAEDFCRRFGYEEPQIQMEGGTGSAVAGQMVDGVRVVNCGVELYFEEGRLTSVTGAHVSLEDASAEPGERMTCVTALVKFLDYRNASGVVCSEVVDARCVYQLQGASAPRLLPLWEIETDTYIYYVDCETGEVSGQ